MEFLIEWLIFRETDVVAYLASLNGKW